MIRLKRHIAMVVILVFVFQVFAPIVDTGFAHKPKECEKLEKKWKKQLDKLNKLNEKMEELKGDRVWQIIKDTALGAVLGSGGAASGAGVANWIWKTAKFAIRKAGVAGLVGGSIYSAVSSYLRTQKEIDNLQKKIDEKQKEVDAAKKAFDDCMNHSHASGSLTPYMNDDIYMVYGDTHYSRFYSTVPFYTVYWYVRAPGQSSYGTLMFTDVGDGSTQNSLFSFTAPHTAGTYTVHAHVYFTDTILDFSYDVYVSTN